MKYAKSVGVGLLMGGLLWSGGIAQEAQSAKKLEVASKISAVVVYPDRAQVTRLAEVELDSGSFEVVFKDLPIWMLDNTVRAKLSGTRTAKISGTEAKRVYVEKPKTEEVKRLQAEIQDLRDKEQALHDSLSVLEQTERFLSSLKAAYSEKVSKEMMVAKLDMEGIGNLVKMMETSNTEHAAKRREVDKQKRDLDDQIRVKENELYQIQSMRAVEYKAVTVDVEGQVKEKITVEVSYVIPGATWRPVYDARLDSEKKEVELHYQGVVTNNTGEKWEDVALALSTAKPALAGQAPDLQARFVDFFTPGYGRDKGVYAPQEQARGLMNQQLAKGGREMEKWDEAKKEIGQYRSHETAEVESGLTAVLFHIRKRETIPSDGQPHKTTVDIEKFNAELEYETAPELTQHGYLKAGLVNKEKWPLLQGEFNIFIDQNFVGTTVAKNVAPNQKFHAYLGVDEGVRIERKEVKREKGTDSGFLKTTRNRQTFAYKITLENFKKTPIKLNVTERIPVSRNQQIEVRTESATTNGFTTDEKKPGLLKWAFELKPQEKKEITIEYSILYPTDKEVAF